MRRALGSKIKLLAYLSDRIGMEMDAVVTGGINLASLAGLGTIAGVLVVGGGLAGCTAAAALARRGIAVTVLEQGALAGAGSGNDQLHVRNAAATFIRWILPVTVRGISMTT